MLLPAREEPTLTNEQTIKWLKSLGLQVKISHRRPILVPLPPGLLLTRAELEALRQEPLEEAEFQPKGGLSRVTILDEDGKTLAVGESLCRPDESFNRNIGLSAALGRAVKAARELGLPDVR